MTIASRVSPMTVIRGSIFLTVPETEEQIPADIMPSGSAICWPISTRSPGATTGFAGAPICWLSG